MPEQTTNLNLPLPLGNENVNRQFFVDLIQAIDSGALSEKQLKDALEQVTLRLADNYLAASALVNMLPDAEGRSYPNGVSFFKVSNSAGGWPTSNGYVVTMRAGSGGYQIFYEMYTGNVQTDKTARQWTRSKRDSNAFWQEWTRGLTEADRALITSWANSVADTRTVNAAPNTYAQGVTREFKTGGIIGLGDTESSVLLVTNKPWTDASGGRAFQEAYGGTTGNRYLRFSNAEGTAWGAFKIEPTYSDISLRPPNLLPNPTGLMDLTSWKPTPASNAWSTNKNDSALAGYFVQSAATGGIFNLLDSDPIVVSPGDKYTFGAYFSGDGAASTCSVEVYGVGGTIISSFTTSGPFLHRKSATITIPPGITQVFVRLVVITNQPAGFRVFAGVSFVRGLLDVYNNDLDTKALFQLVVNGKNDVKNAVVGKGGTVSQAGSVPTFGELTAGVNSISTGGTAEYSTGTGGSGVYDSAGTVANMLSVPRVNDHIIITTNHKSVNYFLVLFGNEYTVLEVAQGANYYALNRGNYSGQGNRYYSTLRFIRATKQAVLLETTSGTEYVTELPGINWDQPFVIRTRALSGGAYRVVMARSFYA